MIFSLTDFVIVIEKKEMESGGSFFTQPAVFLLLANLSPLIAIYDRELSC